VAAVTGSVALPLRAQDGTRYVAHALPLTSGARRLAGIVYSATTALFIRKVAIETLSSPDIIARAYKLTPAELRVLLAIVDIGGVPEVHPRLASRKPPSRPTSAISSGKPASVVRRTWSKSSRAFQSHSPAEAILLGPLRALFLSFDRRTKAAMRAARVAPCIQITDDRNKERESKFMKRFVLSRQAAKACLDFGTLFRDTVMNRENLAAGRYPWRAWRVLVGALQDSRAREARRFIRNNSHLLQEGPDSGGDAAERKIAKNLRDKHFRTA
jgi:hypothetical protein